MDITYLIDKITEANQETLEAYGVSLYDENLSVQSIGDPEDTGEATGGRNTEVRVVANGPRVKGSHTYYYDRIDASSVYPDESALPLSLSDVDSEGLFDAIINSGDPELDMDLITELRGDPSTELVLKYNPDVEIDYDAYVYINSLKYKGMFNIALTVDREEKETIDLAELLSGDTLDGFDQSDDGLAT